MVTMAQRIEELRTQRGLSRPALAAALEFPRMAIEKFETGRQTPTQAQQEKLAAYFGVSAAYLRGEADQMGDWMDGAFQETAAPASAPAPRRAAKAAAREAAEESSVFDAFLNSKKFQEHLRAAVLDALATPEGQALLAKAIRNSGK